jgi:Uma2 family endonuclease
MAATFHEQDKMNERGVTIFGDRRDYDIVVPPDATTHAGFRRWALSDEFPNRGQISFIRGGLVLELGPRPLEYHSCLLGEFVSVLGSIIKEAQMGRFLMRGALLTNLDAEISVEPDAFFISLESLRRKHVQFVPDPTSPKSSKEALGTPDWVLEIVTPTSFRKDKEMLREAYYRAGIYEYWVVDTLGNESNSNCWCVGTKATIGSTRMTDGLPHLYLIARFP